MILATDVHYTKEGSAVAAGIAFRDWPDAAPLGKYTVTIDKVAPYEPGAFYKRELPCLLALLDHLPNRPHIIVIDGFVTLGPDQRPGLGSHLYDAMDRKVPVIGVAKSPFRDTPADCALLRGTSKTPLFVTAAGLPQDRAKAHVAGMHGVYRIPTLLRAVDRLCRAQPLP